MPIFTLIGLYITTNYHANMSNFGTLSAFVHTPLINQDQIWYVGE